MTADAVHLLQLAACCAAGLAVSFYRRNRARSGPRALLASVPPVLGFVLIRVFC